MKFEIRLFGLTFFIEINAKKIEKTGPTQTTQLTKPRRKRPTKDAASEVQTQVQLL